MTQEHLQSLPVGTTIGRYEITEILGEGGFGIVYKATDSKLKRFVVLKEFLPEECAARNQDGQTVTPRSKRSENYQFGLEKFLEEARRLVELKHSNIVSCLDFIEENSTAYLVMEYEEGVALDDYLKSNDFKGGLPEEKINKIIRPILNGLDAVHKKGLLHRDIKPGNIYLRKNKEPMLIDFGAARYALGEHSKSMSAIISMGYAPPEQYSSKGKQGTWTDLYAIGATLYELCFGEAPEESPNRQHAIMDDEADPLISAVEKGKGKYSENLLKTIDWCLTLSAKLRPQSVGDVIAAFDDPSVIASATRQTPSTNEQPSDGKTKVVEQGERFSKPNKKQPPAKTAFPPLNNPLAMIAAAVVIVVCGGGYFAFSHYQEQSRLENEAWELVKQSQSVEGYEEFIAEWPESNQVKLAVSRLETIKKEQQLAKKKQKELVPLIYKAQKYLKTFGYSVSNTGEIDTRTLASVKDFESNLGILVTGVVDKVLVDRMEQYDLDDSNAWEEAQKTHSESAYQNYLKQFKLGKFIENGEEALNHLQSNRAASDKRRKAQLKLTDNGKYKLLNGGKIVLDTTTGLQWMRCSLGQEWNGKTCVGLAKSFVFSEAKYKKHETYAGYHDWRLPSGYELNTLVMCSNSEPDRYPMNGRGCQGEFITPTLYQPAFPNTIPGTFWAISHIKNGGWDVHFDGGTSHKNEGAGSGPYYIRLVRERR